MKIKQKTLNITLFERGNNYCLLIKNTDTHTQKTSWVIILNGHFCYEVTKKAEAIKDIEAILNTLLPENETLTIGQKVKIMREHKGLSQLQLGLLLAHQKTQSEISRLELGYMQPNIRFIQDIQEILECKFYL